MIRAKIRSLVGALLRRRSVELEINEELEFHLERHAEDLATHFSLTREEARRRARLDFGSVEKYKEEAREARGLHVFDEIQRNLRYAIRTLCKNPGFTIVAIATLALGIGANTAIFSAINAVLLNPVGISEPDRVVAVRMNVDKVNLRNSVVSPRDFAEVRDSKDVFATAAIAMPADFNYSTSDLPDRLAGLRVSWQWFDVLGAKPVLGRSFRPEEDQPDSNQVVILAHGAWQRLFGGDTSIVEKTIQLNQLPYKVIGVMGPEHDLEVGAMGHLAKQDVFVPLGLPAQNYGPRNRFNQSYLCLARLQTRVTFDQAQAFMGILTERGLQDPAGDQARRSAWNLFVIPYTDFVAGDMKTPMYVLLGAVGFVLLIACSNIAGLMVAKASARSRDFAVRRALGATGWRLAGQALAETLVLALGGSIIGLGVTYACIRAATVLTSDTDVGGLNIELDMTVLLFTVGVALFSALLFGIAPAWQMARANTDEALKQIGRSGMTGRGPLRLRSLLVTAEVGLALVLLVGAGLFFQSLLNLQQVDLGFRPDGVISGILTLPDARYRDPERRITFYRSAMERLAALPGVTSAAAAIPIPFVGGSAGSFRILGREQREGEPAPHADVRWVTPGFFSTLRIHLKKGRLFTDLDSTTTEDVVIIDENLLQQYWPNQDPIGQKLQRTDGTKPATIVGIVEHVKSSILSDVGKGVLYLPMYQRPTTIAALIVRTDSDPVGLATGVRQVVHSVDPVQPIHDLKTMEERLAATLGGWRFTVILLELFAAIALFMAALGLYGVINYAVTQRTQEIGIRMALGARPYQVLTLIVRQGLRMTLIGVVLGLVAALALARVLASQLFEVSAFDRATFVGMTVLLILVALVASYIPARRAAQADPIVALKYE